MITLRLSPKTLLMALVFSRIVNCERLAGGQWRVIQELGGSGTGRLHRWCRKDEIMILFSHRFKSFHFLGIRQTMWRRGGRCNGVRFQGFSQSKNLNRKKRDKSKHSPQKPHMMKGVEELYLCAGLVWSTMDFWSISKVSFVLKSRAQKNKQTNKR